MKYLIFIAFFSTQALYAQNGNNPKEVQSERIIVSKPKFNIISTEFCQVTLNITINPDGSVEQAELDYSSTTTDNYKILKQAIDFAMQVKYNIGIMSSKQQLSILIERTE